jgi:hypothetical protein
VRTAFVLLTLLVCTAHADIGPRPMPKPKSPGPMTPEPKRTFADGPEVAATDALRSWLDQQRDEQGRPRRVRLPVLVKKGAQPGGVDRKGFVGDEKGLTLELDDTSMGVSLADRYHQLCKEAPSCVLVLDGVVEKGRLRILWIQAVVGSPPLKAQVEVPERRPLVP